MITATAKLTIKRLSIDKLLVKECQVRYPEKLATYMHLLQAHPDDDAGLIHVTPDAEHDGLYIILDGHHRHLAGIMTGRTDALCLIVEEG